jgi:hypothetical protein
MDMALQAAWGTGIAFQGYASYCYCYEELLGYARACIYHESRLDRLLRGAYEPCITLASAYKSSIVLFRNRSFTTHYRLWSVHSAMKARCGN